MAAADQLARPAFVYPTLQPMLLWNDGDGDAPCQHTTEYWDSPKFRSWVYNESPVRDSIVINNRCGTGCVGDYITGSDRWAVWCVLPFLVHPPPPTHFPVPHLPHLQVHSWPSRQEQVGECLHRPGPLMGL